VNIVVDTSVWSLVLRRQTVDESNPYVQAFRSHVQQGVCIHLLGNILQELLDGVKSQRDFDHLVKIMKPFRLLVLERSTYVLASELRNRCRKKGVQAGPIDFLIAAACEEQGYPLLSADRDFQYIAKYCDFDLLDS
jgi:predicted nucleic acid-binding protein